MINKYRRQQFDWITILIPIHSTSWITPHFSSPILSLEPHSSNSISPASCAMTPLFSSSHSTADSNSTRPTLSSQPVFFGTSPSSVGHLRGRPGRSFVCVFPGRPAATRWGLVACQFFLAHTSSVTPSRDRRISRGWCNWRAPILLNPIFLRLTTT